MNISGVVNVASSDVYCKADFVLELSSQLGVAADQFDFGSIAQSRPARANCLGLSVEKVNSILSDSLPNLQEVVKNLIQKVQFTDEVQNNRHNTSAGWK